MKSFHGVVAVGALFTVGLCGWGRAQVLEQVPSDAVGVFEVKDLQALSTKIAKFAKTLGVDQFDPRWADPLASLEDEMGLKQGVNKNGDLAFAFFAPADKKAPAKSEPAQGAAAEADTHGDEPPMVVLIPVDNYKSFLANFQDVKSAGGDVSQVTVPKTHEKLFVVERGKYAASAMDKSLLSHHPGLKLSGAAAKEAQAKDAILYFDIHALRPEMQKGLKEVRQELEQYQKNKGNNAPKEGFSVDMPPVMEKLLGLYLNAAEQMVKDTRSATFSFNLTDFGISTAALGDFEPDSYIGKMVAQVQNTDQTLLAGLPQATYFAFGGMKLTPEVTTQLFNDLVGPVKKALGDQKGAQDIDKMLDAARQALGATQTATAGYAASEGGNGQGIVNTVMIYHGDANKILDAQKQALPLMNSLMDVTGNKSKVEVNFGQPKTVDGVELQTYTMKFNFDANDPQAAQEQQVMSMMYGPNGLSGVMGAVNKDVFLQVQGENEKLLARAIAAAKDNANVLGESASVKRVAAELPKQRAAEYYVALDNIVREGVKFAKKQGLQVQFQLPPNLPPIGATMSTDGPVLRVDSVIPTQLVQSITAAAMQAWMQMNNANGAQGGGGGI